MRWIDLPKDDAELAALRGRTLDQLRDLFPHYVQITREHDELLTLERQIFDEQKRRERHARWEDEGRVA